jgi:predicted DsbA family dithiol-disulfide isomerase
MKKYPQKVLEELAAESGLTVEQFTRVIKTLEAHKAEQKALRKAHKEAREVKPRLRIVS